jgi:hypothetical protein
MRTIFNFLCNFAVSVALLQFFFRCLPYEDTDVRLLQTFDSCSASLFEVRSFFYELLFTSKYNNGRKGIRTHDTKKCMTA